MADLPPAVPTPCNECPWRRASAPGFLGPASPDEWIEIIHSDTAVACHKTVVHTDEDGYGDWEDPSMRQCAGAAIFRANVAKRSRDPQVARAEADTETIFAGNGEFRAHHQEKWDRHQEVKARRARA